MAIMLISETSSTTVGVDIGNIQASTNTTIVETSTDSVQPSANCNYVLLVASDIYAGPNQ